jgi:inner membrane protein
MDSITQAALGAAVGGLVADRQIGRKAMLVGAVIGTLPDLDVLVPLSDAVETFTYHRSFSHSLLVLTLVSPLAGWLLHRMFSAQLSFRRSWLLTWLVLITHILLDSLTVYGTQIFWPVSDYPVSGSSVFIIDPLYTLILLLGLAALFRRSRRAQAINCICLCLTSAYLCWAVAAKLHIARDVEASLTQQSVQYDKLLTTPMPFNTLGWRFVAMQDNGYLEGFASVLDPVDHVYRFNRFVSRNQLLDDIESHWPVARLRRFTHGFYKVQRQDDEIQMVDLRMGAEGAYIFAFVVGKVTAQGSVAVPAAEADTPRDFSGLPHLFKRIFDADAVLK